MSVPPGVSLTLWCFVVYFLRGDLMYVLPCAILFLCFSVHLTLRLPRLGKRELILVFFVRLIDLCLFGFVGFLLLLMSGKGCGLWLWHSLDFSLTSFCAQYIGILDRRTTRTPTENIIYKDFHLFFIVLNPRRVKIFRNIAAHRPPNAIRETFMKSSCNCCH